ncbi:hypothetical protein ABIF44_007181 [Bradyrhizobium japonicum]|nr:hypothetical protein RN69_38405 [Bradyrhizobium japonicum]BAL13156.1 hypothetical protein BJ6T_79100 [Bradyrhizobium japonicum USDA 6]KMK00040.1 hypothetical protein CF64_05155 [Bradyrhizobium japonicum]MCS3537374.1 hypothetical protein [Bradyrhizobium japonicum]MCS3986539.1 hypothetical protein [Bradyrhizobium japonicum]
MMLSATARHVGARQCAEALGIRTDGFVKWLPPWKVVAIGICSRPESAVSDLLGRHTRPIFDFWYNAAATPRAKLYAPKASIVPKCACLREFPMNRQT